MKFSSWCNRGDKESMIRLNVNNNYYELDVETDTPLLWALRDEIGLTGTKFGCGIAQCGACTVHVDGMPQRSCVLPVGGMSNKKITTIEHLAGDGYHPVQQAWLELQVPQCGYCQSGQLMSAAALLADNPSPSDADIDKAMSGNICRCGTYQRIRAAIHRAAELQREIDLELSGRVVSGTGRAAGFTEL